MKTKSPTHRVAMALLVVLALCLSMGDAFAKNTKKSSRNAENSRLRAIYIADRRDDAGRTDNTLGPAADELIARIVAKDGVIKANIRSLGANAERANDLNRRIGAASLEETKTKEAMLKAAIAYDAAKDKANARYGDNPPNSERKALFDLRGKVTDAVTNYAKARREKSDLEAEAANLESGAIRAENVRLRREQDELRAQLGGGVPQGVIQRFGNDVARRILVPNTGASSSTASSSSTSASATSGAASSSTSSAASATTSKAAPTTSASSASSSTTVQASTYANVSALGIGTYAAPPLPTPNNVTPQPLQQVYAGFNFGQAPAGGIYGPGPPSNDYSAAPPPARPSNNDDDDD
jgi:hypothetical protein